MRNTHTADVAVWLVELSLGLLWLLLVAYFCSSSSACYVFDVADAAIPFFRVLEVLHPFVPTITPPKELATIMATLSNQATTTKPISLLLELRRLPTRAAKRATKVRLIHSLVALLPHRVHPLLPMSMTVLPHGQRQISKYYQEVAS